MTGGDPYNLQRFLETQARWIDEVYKELGNGYKVGHWMWFIFPQLKGLGRSATSHLCGISSLEEAQAYLAHSVLGPRLSHSTSLVLGISTKSIELIFDDPDDLKFRSSMTLFAEASTEDQRFRQALEKYFGGKPDLLTIERLNGER
jgi:uncharacterized protein (DUF1810 family)